MKAIEQLRMEYSSLTAEERLQMTSDRMLQLTEDWDATGMHGDIEDILEADEMLQALQAPNYTDAMEMVRLQLKQYAEIIVCLGGAVNDLFNGTICQMLGKDKYPFPKLDADTKQMLSEKIGVKKLTWDEVSLKKTSDGFVWLNALKQHAEDVAGVKTLLRALGIERLFTYLPTMECGEQLDMLR
jgi:hypothetical protein